MNVIIPVDNRKIYPQLKLSTVYDRDYKAFIQELYFHPLLAPLLTFLVQGVMIQNELMP